MTGISSQERIHGFYQMHDRGGRTGSKGVPVYLMRIDIFLPTIYTHGNKYNEFHVACRC